ncbi:MAG: RimK family alpha-L-glutamate ligase [Saprospiraceae bacterium]|nr:RimK family alpha-L-glutamate ligase [Saprospiraceae bacterium]
MNIVILSRSYALYSTQSLYKAAVNRGHHVRIIDYMMCDLFIKNGEFRIFHLGEELISVDAVIPRIGVNVTDYGSLVIRHFEQMNIFSTMSSESLIRTRNKFGSLQLLAKYGVPTPDTAISWNYENIEEFVNNFGSHPAVIKLLSSTHGEGVIKSDNSKMSSSLMEAFLKLNHDVLIQKFITESTGTDIRAFVVGNKLVAAMERIAQSGEFRSNIHRGALSKPIRLTKEEIRIAKESTKIMGLQIAGVDIMRSNSGPVVIEVNASPGLEGIETTTRVNVAKSIITHVENKKQDLYD